MILSLLYLYQRGKGEVKQLKLAIKTERIKRGALIPLKAGLLMTPGAMVTVPVIDEVFDLLNKYTNNYKRLQELLK